MESYMSESNKPSGSNGNHNTRSDHGGGARDNERGNPPKDYSLERRYVGNSADKPKKKNTE